jgi:hypothetical protein
VLSVQGRNTMLPLSISFFICRWFFGAVNIYLFFRSRLAPARTA